MIEKAHRLFISHSWTYNNAKDTIVRFLDKVGLDYQSLYIPKKDPVHETGPDQQLLFAITEKIKRSSCLIILAGVFPYYDRWIEKEIEVAKELGKPIIAIQPWSNDKTSELVKRNANRIVKWQVNQIVEAIKDIDKYTIPYTA